MRHANYNVFDDFVPKAFGQANAVYTSNKFNRKLGHYDQLAVQIVTDNISGSGTLSCQLEHSADGRNFSPWNTSPPDITSGMTSTPLVITAPTASQTRPLLGFVRIAMWFSDGSTSAHLKVYCTQRDTGA